MIYSFLKKHFFFWFQILTSKILVKKGQRKVMYFPFFLFQVFNRDEPDREKLVHVTVKASDKGRPQLEDVCTLSVKVKDKNDNKPIFDRGQYDEPVAQDTPVGTQIMRVSATDVDEGENQKISYDLSATRIPGLFITFIKNYYIPSP